MIEYLEIKRFMKKAEVLTHDNGRMVVELDITTVEKESVTLERIATDFREIDGVQESLYDPANRRFEIDYDTQKIEPSLLDMLVEDSRKEEARDAQAATDDYEITEIPSSPEEIEAIRYKNPGLAEKIELVHQLRFIMTSLSIREAGINAGPLKGILEKLDPNAYSDMLSPQKLMSVGWGLVEKFLAKAFD